MRLFLSAVLLLTGLASATAQETERVFAPADQKAVSLRIAREFVAPRYEAFAARAEEQRAAWHAFCVAPAPAGVSTLLKPFADTAIAWASVELVRYGPVSENFRYESIAYWPERRNDVARALARLLAEPAPADAASMAGRSVAVQGLSALERLLHDDGDAEAAKTALLAGDDDAKKRCAAGEAIAGNLVRLAGEVRTGWTTLVTRLESADDTLAREAVSRFATDLLTVYQITGDAKIDVPMSRALDTARPKNTQYWRSGLSNATLAANLASAADLTEIVLGADDSGTIAVRDAQRLAETLPQPLPDLVASDAGRSRVLLLRAAIRGAADLTSETVPAALGVTVGFNSLDGD